MGHATGLAYRLTLFILLAGAATAVLAAKVSVDPGQWGHEAGQKCASCHTKASAGLVGQWEKSAHAEAGVNCMDCHKAETADADAFDHEGFVIATIVSPADCGRCHETEYRQHKGSVHAEAAALAVSRDELLVKSLGGPAVKAVGCDQCHGSVVRVRGDGTLDPRTWPNTGIGRVNPDGSKGSCSSCHGRHEFSRAQAREPEACVRCHSGPDSPDKAVYEVSKHGMLFRARRDEMNLDSDDWVAGKDYDAAPTCATCHMSAAGKLPSNHDVGLRNTWTLNAPVSYRQHLVVFEDGSKRELAEDDKLPRRGSEFEKMDGSTGKVKAVATAQRRRMAMQAVCLECHSKGFAEGALKQFDDLVVAFNDKYAKPARDIMEALYAGGHLTPRPFDEPLEFTYWELWHDEGARARHGAAMGSPDHAWWDGLYVVGRNFYSRFIPQAREAAGESGRDIVEQRLSADGEHGWLAEPGTGSPLLGYPQPASDPNE